MSLVGLMKNSRSLGFYSVPSSSSGVFLGYWAAQLISLWQLSLEQFFGAKAGIPVFKMSTETRMLLTTPSVSSGLTNS